MKNWRQFVELSFFWWKSVAQLSNPLQSFGCCLTLLKMFFFAVLNIGSYSRLPSQDSDVSGVNSPITRV